jgi:hypothetical protein
MITSPILDIDNGKLAFTVMNRQNFYYTIAIVNMYSDQVQHWNCKEMLKEMDSLFSYPEMVRFMTIGITIVGINFQPHSKLYLVINSSGSLIANFSMSIPSGFSDVIVCDCDRNNRLYCFNRNSQIVYISKFDL